MKTQHLPKWMFRNLDCMPFCMLEKYMRKMDKHRDREPEWDEEGETVHRILLEYASYKSMAILDRGNGYIQMAMDMEKECEKLYNQLPEYAKW